jgi:hypothetical protein
MNVKININFFFSFCAYSLGICSFFFDNSIRYSYGFVFFFWFFIIFRDNLFEKVNVQILILLIILIMLFLIPSIGIYFYKQQDLTHILFIFLLCFDLFQKFFDKPTSDFLISKKEKLSKKDLIIYFMLSFWSILGPFLFGQGNSLIGMTTFMFPFAVSLIYLEKIMKILKTPIYGGFFLFYHFLFTIIWLSNHWWGMGRLFLFYIILSPVIIYFHYCKIAIKRLLVFACCPLALFTLQFSRYKQFSFENFLIGSAGYHLELTNMVYSTQYFIESKWNIFFNEYILMFLILFPRDYWPSKPFPIGWWAVEVLFGNIRGDSSGIIGEFSISMGFIGENMLMLGNEFYIGLIFSVLSIIILRKIIFYLSFRSIVPIVIFDLCLASYFWGGVAIFGARLWVTLIPVLLLLLIINIHAHVFKKNKNNIKIASINQKNDQFRKK